MAQQQAEDPCEVLRAVKSACARAEAVAVCGGMEGLTLADTTSVLDSVTETLEALVTVVKALDGRAAKIRDQGVGLLDGSALMVIADAREHLHYAGDVLEASCHLVGVGLKQLLRVERGKR